MFRPLLAIAFPLACGLMAQDVRELSTPTDQLALTSVSTATIAVHVSNGFRLTDIEYRGTVFGAAVFDAVLVQNSGPYATGWWWYYNQTAAQVSAALASNQARLIDLEPYDDGSGNLRFACIMVDNTGANQKAWGWLYHTTTTSIGAQLTNNNMRLVDLDSCNVGGTGYYSAVMIGNTGADQRSWWWYLNVTAAQIGTYVSTHQARIYDLEKRSNGNWDCVLIRDVASVGWYWWYDLQTADVTRLVGQYGVRVTDLETYTVSGIRRWAMVAINNSNALTTAVGNAMRGRTDGTVGCWMQQINGPVIANLNGDTQFEPCSTMKTLHHVHAMRRVLLGLALSTPLNVFTNYSPTNASCPIDTGATTEWLQTVLRLMMENSDNARTQAVTAYFLQSNINATAATLGMASTSLNHRLGCGAEAVLNPNRITLRDLQTLHSQVANGWLGNQRDMFYTLMLDSVTRTGR